VRLPPALSRRLTLAGRGQHNCRVVDIEASGNACQAFAVEVPSTDNLANLMGRQISVCDQLDPISESARSAFASARSNKLGFELRRLDASVSDPCNKSISAAVSCRPLRTAHGLACLFRAPQSYSTKVPRKRTVLRSVRLSATKKPKRARSWTADTVKGTPTDMSTMLLYSECPL
jgi:hypothetical protein